MRRKEREITGRGEMEAILGQAQVCRVAMLDGNEPYVVPLCFGYADNAIWIHSALAGKKIGALARNPRVCVEVDLHDGPIPDARPCSWEFRYRSVICTGTARIVTDYQEKREGLSCILQHYGAGEHEFSESELDRVCVVKIEILEMTGKKYGYPDGT
jgi:nitroimidazol reductase NimA-like FMN-containing flavoprotein (pyridoxamine 5'-phosphate oxidase superfamily)